MEEWKTYKLGDLVKLSSGGTPNKAKQAYWGGNIPWISAKAMYGDTISTSDLFITEEGLQNGSKLANVGSTLLLTRGSGLFNHIPVCLVTAPVAYNQDVKCITTKSHEILSDTFLYYWLFANKAAISAILETTGIGAGKIDTQRLLNLDVLLPARHIQDHISHICHTLFDKIALNNRINHNLEEQAQALYKSWFVDFEPFKVGKFVESELGMIPEGWRVGQLSEICEIVGGGTPSKAKSEYYTDNGIHWLTPKDLSISCKKFTCRGQDDITELGYKSSSAKLMPKGTVLFSSRAPIGYITIAKNPICTNQGFKSAVSGTAGTAFLYYYLKTNTENIENLSTGSTFKEASGSLMKSLAVVIPPKEVFDEFEEVMAGLFASQENIESENFHHEIVRDSLLPRLMSGKLNINEIDC